MACRRPPRGGRRWGGRRSGVRAAADRWRRCSLISDGPVAQLSPTMSTFSGSMAARAALISVPRSIRPVSSIVTWHWIGTWRPTAAIARRAPMTDGLHGEEVEVGLEDEEVDPALEQAAAGLLVGVAQLGEADLAQRRGLGAGAERAGHEALPVRRREAVGHLAGDAGVGQGDLVGALGDVVLAERHGEGAEGVGLDHVGADLEVGRVEGGHHVGSGDAEDVGAALERRATEVVEAQVLGLHPGAGGAVVDDDALGHGVQECTAFTHHARLPRPPRASIIRSRRRPPAPGPAWGRSAGRAPRG